MSKKENKINKLNQKIIKCKKCPRLSAYIQEIAKNKVKRFSNDQYWGKPLPGFGDVKAQLLIIGLAPAAHGGNRTGRMFTGDSSGDWVARTLFNNGFASKPKSIRLNDGFNLKNAYITAAVRCAPPKNKPTKAEFDNCLTYLESELEILENIKIIICLGRIAFDTCNKILNFNKKKFSHGKSFLHHNLIIICSYHPSKQNTQTGRLSWNQWNSIFRKANKILNSH